MIMNKIITEQKVIDITIKTLYRCRGNIFFLTPNMYRLFVIKIIEDEYGVLTLPEEEKIRVSKIAAKSYNDIKANLKCLFTFYTDDSDVTRDVINDDWNSMSIDIKKPYIVLPYHVTLGDFHFYEGYWFDNEKEVDA